MTVPNFEKMADILVQKMIDGELIEESKRDEVKAIWVHFAKGFIEYISEYGVTEVGGESGTISFPDAP